MNNSLKLLIGLMVLTIFTVGCVSAENVTDVEVPTDEINVDDAVVDVVENEELELEEESNSPTQIAANSTSEQIQGNISNGGSFIFESGQYDNPIYNITLSNNTTLDGNGVTLTGNGANDIFLVYNCHNVTIKNFVLNINGAKHGIYGANVTNSTFDNLTIYNARDGININEYQEGLTITNNNLYNITRDGISVVNHRNYTDSELSTLNSTLIAYNNIQGAEIGIYVGGTFKGNIQNNEISDFSKGIEFDGKPIGTVRNIIGNITDNTITDGDTGIVFINETLYDLTMDSNTISEVYTGIYAENVIVNSFNITFNTIETNDEYYDYIMSVSNFTKVFGGFFGMTFNYLFGCIKINPIGYLLNEDDPNYGAIIWEG